MSPAVIEFMEELATDVAKQRAFREQPVEYVASSRLTPEQQSAVLSGDIAEVRSMLTEHSNTKEAPGALVLVLLAAQLQE
jgi:hypothetical protein